ncbi:MAG: tripartite tricarboxylate transporter substrate binding protein [Acidobacteria bacterium]|nr:tripartite tricarboxylate transporter substrate binding protein [Acidobacteriota bacterium]
MSRPIVTRPAAACTLAAAVLACPPALAQTYPVKPVRIVVGVPPGGTTDVVARLVGQKLAGQLGQQVVIDNRGGAGGNIGAELVAKSAADGYTLFLATIGTMTINPHLYRQMPFDTLRDFAAVSQLTSMPQVLALHPSIPARTLRDLIALARAQPGNLNFASGGSGTAIHLAGELFKSMTGTQMVHVPYKGSAPAMTDLLSGQVSLMFDQIVTAMPHVQSGRLRALGVTTAKRSAIAPDLPTLAESGLPGYEITTWHGLLAPAGTPREIVAKLSGEAARALQAADVREKFAGQGVDPVSSTPEQFHAFMQSELEKWGKVVKASGARIL